ncbi:PolC-type DNA polymerase III [Veillonella sp. YH-vei2232]|uniref:DNA polymerase III PolC-type n=2 Tax=Veillonella absiana TaxID=3079305 RepID=A0ABU3ZAL4_9FIRM|nr:MULTISPECIES: PolC-type DNA polymerase III [unclassified Veillonella]MDV5063638.1 PolC-type DNA polymerase III [Veillonella sp. YH-vei2232]MDV5088965.1 PolC-type DNA polymerase III [Veillonella sp. YH-vei2233]
MKVRYRIVPKQNKKAAFYVNCYNKQIKIEAIDANFSTLTSLQEKLATWYREKNISFTEIPNNANNECCFAWSLNPQTGEGMDTYYYGGGCGVGELIEEMEARRQEQMGDVYESNFGDVQNFDDSYGYAPGPDEYDEDDEFKPMMQSSGLSYFDDAPVVYDYVPNRSNGDGESTEATNGSDGTANGGSNGTASTSSKTVGTAARSMNNGSSAKSGANGSYGNTSYNNGGFNGSGKFGGKSSGKKNFKGGAPRKDLPTDEGMVLGPNIEGEVVDIMSVQSGGRNLVFEGVFVGLDKRDTKTGKSIVNGSIVDKTNSIKFIKFTNTPEEGAALLKQLKGLKGALVQGDVDFEDCFENDFILNLRSVKAVDHTVERNDTRDDSEKRVELHLHTKMSDKDALVTVKDLFKTVKKWGHPAVAITDHGVVQAFPEAQALGKELGVKVIYGVEAYLIDDENEDKRFHIILLAKNMVGLRNLYKMISISHLDYFKRRPRLPREVIQEHREGIIIGSACEAGELMQSIIKGKPKERLLDIASFYDYLEIQPHTNNMFLLRKGLVPDEQSLIDMNKTIIELGEALDIPVCATCDVHYLNPEEKIYREIMLTASGFTDANEQPDLHLRTTDEMLVAFPYLSPEKAFEVVVTNTRNINDSIENIKPVPDGTYSPKIEGADQSLEEMCYKNAEALYGSPLPAPVQERLEYELTRIIRNGYGVLYYIAHKLVKKSLDEGYLVGSRGSVGSSFVATMAEITEVNPLPPHYVCPHCKWSEFFLKGEYAGGFDLPRKKCPECGTDLKTNGHDIPFAIFMGFEGDKVPDIDLNFSGDYQAKAHKYTEELFGRDNVFKAGTIGTIADKTAFGYVRKYAEIRGIQARNGFFEALAKGFTNVKNTTGQHPGGIMVCPRDMDVHHFTPIQYPANKKESGVITTHFDYHSIEGRMTKLDILGHDDPTIIRMLEDLTGVDVQDIPFDDPQTLSLFSSTEAIGLTPEQLQGDKVASLAVPECGTSFVRRMLEDSRPQCFSDLVRISGFSHGTNVWLDNAQDLIKNNVCKLNEAISTRDDIMNYLMHRGMEPLKCFFVMENVRKGKGIEKKNKQGQPTTDFEGEMRANNIPDWFIDSCKKISYLFPRAHAVAYVMMAFRIAWFKINYPLAFYAAYFSIRAKAFDLKIMTGDIHVQLAEFKRIKALDRMASPKEKDLMSALEVSMEMCQRGFRFINVDLEHSQARRFSIKDGALLPPFLAIESLGEKVADAIVEERNQRPFTSLKDMQRRCKVSNTIIETMKDLKCTGNLPEDEQMSLFGM